VHLAGERDLVRAETTTTRPETSIETTSTSANCGSNAASSTEHSQRLPAARADRASHQADLRLRKSCQSQLRSYADTHHVTNVVVTAWADGQVQVRSKGLGIKADGSCGSVSYEDTVVRTADGWRISYRRISPRRTPLGGMTKPG
jgi:hypothetical protein